MGMPKGTPQGEAIETAFDMHRKKDARIPKTTDAERQTAKDNIDKYINDGRDIEQHKNYKAIKGQDGSEFSVTKNAKTGYFEGVFPMHNKESMKKYSKLLFHQSNETDPRMIMDTPAALRSVLFGYGDDDDDISEYSKCTPKEQVRMYLKCIEDFAPRGTRISADSEEKPMSVDTYAMLLKMANRMKTDKDGIIQTPDGLYELFYTETPISGKFNNQTFKNIDVYNAWKYLIDKQSELRQYTTKTITDEFWKELENGELDGIGGPAGRIISQFKQSMKESGTINRDSLIKTIENEAEATSGKKKGIYAILELLSNKNEIYNEIRRMRSEIADYGTKFVKSFNDWQKRICKNGKYKPAYFDKRKNMVIVGFPYLRKLK